MSGPRLVRPAALGPGSVVLAYLQAPRERFWGVIRSLDATGLVLQGIELDSFDDWLRQLGSADGQGLSPSVVFFPLLRVEKVLLDQSGAGIPSLAERFERRAGRSIVDYFDER